MTEFLETKASYNYNFGARHDIALLSLDVNYRGCRPLQPAAMRSREIPDDDCIKEER
jgi:hypothetical protein